MSTTAKKKRKEKRNRKRKNQVNDAPVSTFMRVSALPGRLVPSGMRQRKKEKEKKKGGRHTG